MKTSGHPCVFIGTEYEMYNWNGGHQFKGNYLRSSCLDGMNWES